MNRAAIETVRAIDRRIPLWPWHRERLMRAGLTAIPDEADLAAALPMGRLRVRVDVEAKGWSVSWEELGEPWHGLVLDVAHEPYVNSAPLVKWRDRDAYEAAFASRAGGSHDALLHTPEGHVSETTRMSIFWLKEGTLHTPDDACAPLHGVARSRVMDWSPWPVRAGLFTLEDLEAAECVFGSNAVRGLVWVRRVGGREWVAPSPAFTAFQAEFERKAYG